MDDIEIMIRKVAGKESSILCREVTSIGYRMTEWGQEPRSIMMK